MRRYGFFRKSLSICVLLSLLLSSAPGPGAAPPAESATAQPASALASAPQTTTGLYRTRVAVPTTAQRQRLEKLGVTVLEPGGDWAMVLVDGDQLADLARLRFEPSRTDELGLLVAANASSKPWLPGSLQPLLTRALEVERQRSLGVLAEEQKRIASAEVRGMVGTLTKEQQAGLSALTTVDDDGDGLTNTEEIWWCTDSGNPNTRGLTDFNDGDRVRRLKDWIANRRSGPPLDSGKPFKGWPSKDTTAVASCQDDDGDDVPDAAEQYALGLNPNRDRPGLNSNQYSTARDRFSDGLKLYGSDSTRSELPAYLKPPGSHPLVAAYPVVDIQVVPNSLTVQPVTTITTEKGTMRQTAKTYQTSVTDGTSTSVADTVTWNEWQEVSTTTALGSQSATASPQAIPPGNGSGDVKAAIAPLAIAGAVIGFCIAYGELAGTLGIGELLGNDRLNTCGGVVREGVEGVVKFAGSVKSPPTSVPIEFPPGTSIDLSNVDLDTAAMAEALKGCRIDSSGNLTCDVARTPANQDIARDQGAASAGQDRGSGASGTQLSSDGQSSVTVQRRYQVSVPAPRFLPTRTTTSGKSWGGAQTTTHTQYQEVTNTEGTSYTDGEDWRTAVAQDAAHAAELWFTYRLSNRGTDYAGRVCEATFSIYIGNDRIPTAPYRPAVDLNNEDGCFHDLAPGVSVDYPTSHIVLTLDQIRAIDTGQPIRVNLESFTLRDQTLDFANARGAGVLLGIEDGNDDGNEQIDQYLIARWRDSDSVQDILARYFPFDTDGAGNIIAIWTPKYQSDTPAWCVEPRRPYDNPDVVVWCKHAISTAEWWTIYLNNLGDGTSALKDTLARAGSQLLFRFNKDSDGDGYSDRTERKLRTHPLKPASFPKPELIAGIYAYPHTAGPGTLVTATLSLLNTGPNDAYGVEAVMIAPDDSVSIVNNTVGGSGRVRAFSPVIVGSKVLTPTISPSTWHGTANPASGGYYTGTVDTTYSFTVSCPNTGGCDVGSGTWNVGWTDGRGDSGSLALGNGYRSPQPLDVGSLGVKVSFSPGRMQNADTFTVKARRPRDTFQYAINREPHTAPIVIVSYNDPQGNHRFATPPATMALSHPADDLTDFGGKMLKDPGVDIVTTAPLNATLPSVASGSKLPSPSQGEGPGIGVSSTSNILNLVVNNPSDKTLVNAHLFLEFVNLSGTVVSEAPVTVTLPSGPSVVPVAWSTDAFSPTYQPNQDYLVMAFLTDYQGNIINTAARPLSSFQVDPRPALALNAADLTWDFGTVQQGTLMPRQFTLANTGFIDLLTYLGKAPGISVVGPASRSLSPGDMGVYTVTINTALLETGPFERSIPIRTSDPVVPTRTLTVRGTVAAMAADTPGGAVPPPLDFTLNISGNRNQGDPYDFTHTLGPDPESLHPCKVYDHSRSTLKGVGKYCSDFDGGTVSYSTFGTGRDGDLTVTAGQTMYMGVTRTAVVGPATKDQDSLPVATTSGFGIGDEVLIIQSQGAGAGNYEFNTITNISPGSIVLQKSLKTNYDGFAFMHGACGTTGVGMLGEYFTNPDLGGSPIFTDCDSTIKFDLRAGGWPKGGVPNTNFSVRWTGQFAVPTDGNYSFEVHVDDGVRIYVDGILLLDKWSGPTGGHTASRFITAGIHSLVVWYRQWGGDAYINFTPPIKDVKAQVIKVPHYRNVTVQSGGMLTVPVWDRDTGGIIAFRSNGTVTINGTVANTGGSGNTATSGYPQGGAGGGYHGGQGDAVNSDNGGSGFQGEGTTGFGWYKSDPNGNGGGAGGGRPETGGFGTGGGGGNGTAGNSSTAGGIGAGGSVAGNPQLTEMVFGGGGGGSNDNPGNSIGGGGAGGGIIVLAGKTIAVNGAISANGGQGGGDKWGGGAGGGGSILIQGEAVSLGTNLITAVGGAARNGGGAGGNGRIRIESCETATGSTNPTTTVVKLPCHIAEQVESAPYNTTRLSLPESFTGGRTYQIQFGRRYAFSAAGQDTKSIRLPKRLYSSVGLDALVSNTNSASGSLNLSLYVGADATPAWSYNQTTNFPATLPTANVAAALNAYLVSQSNVAWGGEVDVPFKVQVDRKADVMLTNLVLTPAGSKNRFLRLPARTYGDVRLDLQFGQTGGGTGALAYAVDVGADGSIEWSGGGTYPMTVNSPENLAQAVNAYLAGKTGEVDVPIWITSSPDIPTSVVGFSAVPSATTDVTLANADLGFGAANPIEGDTVAITATVRNSGAADSGPLTVSFFASAPGLGKTYVGSDFVANVPANGITTTALAWNTLGFTGPVTVSAVADFFGRVPETQKDNNTASKPITITTRPDLSVTRIELSNPEPVVGESVAVTLHVRNTGQTAAPSQAVALYAGNPEAGGSTVGVPITLPVPGRLTETVTFTWVPTTTGPARLFALADRNAAVGEFDEGNNQAWREVYVGFRGPIALDSGTAADLPYTAERGYGYVDEGEKDVPGDCGGQPHETFRSDPDGKVTYRFDHLLPHHFYHLDLTLYQCNPSARLESVYVDGNLITGSVNLPDGKVHSLSVLLDPALYADRTISVTVQASSIWDAVVSQVNLHDVDYRYADAGGDADQDYPGSRAFGALEGSRKEKWGVLPYQSVRVNLYGNLLRYQFDGLTSTKRYQVNLTFWNPDEVVAQKVQINGGETGAAVTTAISQVHPLTIKVPPGAYANGSIVVGIVRTDANAGAMVNEIALEEVTPDTPREVDLRLLPASNAVRVGQVFTTSIQVEAGSKSLDGAAAYLDFDPAYLEVVDEEGNPATSITPGPGSPSGLDPLNNSVDNTIGRINYTAVNLSGTISGTFTLATLRFKALAQTPPGGTEIRFASDDENNRRTDVTSSADTSTSNPTGSVLRQTFNATAMSSQIQVVGSVTLQGRPARPHLRWAVPVTLTLLDPGTSTVLQTIPLQTDQMGVFTTTEVLSGTYDLRVKKASALSSRVKSVTITSTHNLCFGTLYEGDANGDDKVNLTDFNILKLRFGSIDTGDGKFDSRPDFNGDRKIDLTDFNRLKNNFNKMGPIDASCG